ncbi:MAG: MipA/OmpV family protein [Pseudomonadota bacterium]
MRAAFSILPFALLAWPLAAQTQELSAGVLSLSAPQYAGAQDYEFGVVPFLRYETERLTVTTRGAGIAVDLVPGPRLNAGPILSYDFGRDPSEIDNAFVAALPQVDATLEIGGFAEIAHPLPSLGDGLFLGAGIEVRTAVDGGHDGTIYSPSIGLRSVQDGTTITGDLSLTITDDRYADAYFSGGGFDPDGGLQDISVSVVATHPLTDRLSLIGLLSVSAYQGDAADSPVTTDNTDYLLGIGTAFNF